jgi:molecular chaperone GrpE
MMAEKEKKHKTKELNPEDLTNSGQDIRTSADDLLIQMDALQKEVDAQKGKADEYLDALQRERADFINYKKRIEKDILLAHQNAAGNITKRYLAILDDLERALKNRPAGEEGQTWAQGIELIYRKLQSILDSDGIKEVDCEKKIFDPNFHEALTHEDSPAHKSGQIIEVVQKGYLIGDRVLRPALVRVAR